MGIFDNIKITVPEGIVDSAVQAIVSNVANVANGSNAADAGSMGIVGDSNSPSVPQQNVPSARSAYGWSNELEKMVTMVIEDGVCSEKELSMLKKCAEREGIIPEEFELKLELRIRQHEREVEARKNINPVVALSQAFKMLESYAKDTKKAVDGAALSGVLALVPGVGMQAALVGTLLSEFIEAPSNLNNLKAEAIRLFVLPQKADQLREFIQYAGSQLHEENVKKASELGLKKILSLFVAGDELDIRPIWENKIEDACSLALQRFNDDGELMEVVNRYRPTLISKLRQGIIDFETAKVLPSPIDEEDLINSISFFYSKKSDAEFWMRCGKDFHEILYNEATVRLIANSKMRDDVLLTAVAFFFSKKKDALYWEKYAKSMHKSLYDDAEIRFDKKPEMKEQLKNYKVKVLGIF